MTTSRNVVKTSTKVVEAEVMVPLSKSGWNNASLALPPVEKLSALSSQEVESRLKTIQKSGKAVKMLVHTTACGILMRYVDHGDYSQMIKLHAATKEALGTGAANKLAQWVSTNSTVKWNDKETWYYDSVKGDGKDAKKFHLSLIDTETNKNIGAAFRPFWDMPAQDNVVEYNMFKMMVDFFERLQRSFKAIEDKKAKGIASQSLVDDFKVFLEEHSISFTEEGKPVVPTKEVLKEQGILIKAAKAPRGAKKTTAKAKRPRAAKPKASVTEAGETAAEQPAAA